MFEIIFVIAVLIVGIVSAEWDNWFGGLVTFAGTAAIVQWWFNVPLMAIALANPSLVVLSLVAYILVGLVYASFVRFPRWIDSKRVSIEQAWKEHVNVNKKENPECITEHHFQASYRFQPFTASHNADRIASWAVLWPWGLAWDAANRPIRWIYRHVHSMFAGILERQERAAIRRIQKGP